MDRQPRRRRRKALMWGGVLVVVGVVVGVVMLIMAFVRLDDKVSEFYRLDAPDVAEVFFGDTGDYVIYDESIGLPVDGESPFEITVTRTGTGLEVPVSASVDDISYDTSGNEGTAIFEFSIPAVGTYEIETSVSTESGLAQLAVGRSVLGDLVRGIVMALVIGGGIVLAGVLLAIVGSIPKTRTETAEGSKERTGGSRERASERSEPEPEPGHGRSPLERRGDTLRADEARVEEARVEEARVEEARVEEARVEEARAEASRAGESPPPPPPEVLVETLEGAPPPPPEVLAEAAEVPPPPPPPEELVGAAVEPKPSPTEPLQRADESTYHFEPPEPLAVEPVSLDESGIEIYGLGEADLEVAGLSRGGLEVAGLGDPLIEFERSPAASLLVADIEVNWLDSEDDEGDSLRP